MNGKKRIVIGIVLCATMLFLQLGIFVQGAEEPMGSLLPDPYSSPPYWSGDGYSVTGQLKKVIINDDGTLYIEMDTSDDGKVDFKRTFEPPVDDQIVTDLKNALRGKNKVIINYDAVVQDGKVVLIIQGIQVLSNGILGIE